MKSLGVMIGLTDQALLIPTTPALLDDCPGLAGFGPQILPLPRDMGGLGVRRCAQVSTPAWAASWLNAMKWLSSNHLPLFELVSPHLLPDRALQVLSSVKLSDLGGRPIASSEDLDNYLRVVESPPPQRTLTLDIVDKPNRQLLIENLSHPDHKEFKAYYLSEANPHTHLWLSAGLSKNFKLKLSDNAFATNIRLRLLQPIFRRNPMPGVTCVCSQRRLKASAVHFHCFSCGAKTLDMLSPGPQLSRYRRHNETRDCLVNFLKVACPEATVMAEAPLPRVAGQRQGGLRADVSLSDEHGNYTLFDVVYTNPSSAHSVTNSHAQDRPLAAAEASEHRKLALYRSYYNQRNNMAHVVRQVVPFAIEITGALGPSAFNAIMKYTGYVEMHAENPNIAAARRWFLKRISIIAAKARHESVTYFCRHAVQDQIRTRPGREVAPEEDPVVLEELDYEFEDVEDGVFNRQG
jgi:hypothetical protein